MCWRAAGSSPTTASGRCAVRRSTSCTRRSWRGPVDSWKALRAAIRDEVCTKGFDQQQGTFVQAYGSRAVDAALLLIPCVGFLPARDPRVRGTIAAIEEALV